MINAYIAIKFSREVLPDDVISPGGYTIVCKNGDTYEFDFNQTVGAISKESANIVEFELSDYELIAKNNSYHEEPNTPVPWNEISKMTEAFVDIESDNLKVESIESFDIYDGEELLLRMSPEMLFEAALWDND